MNINVDVLDCGSDQVPERAEAEPHHRGRRGLRVIVVVLLRVFGRQGPGLQIRICSKFKFEVI